MCGIAGILSIKQTVRTDELKQMTDAIKHRGPDGEGHWVAENQKVGFGHRRLSILDLSENGKQPMHYAKGDLTLTFNGEIYNYLEIKEQLVKKGYQFKSESDSEVLLALYQEKDTDCLEDLDGMFAFAIWDQRKQRLFCARDRFGEKPFFYSFQDGNFVFASEMKAMFGIKGLTKTPNQEKLFYYLAFNFIEVPQKIRTTFFENISKLEPAHYLTLDLRGNIDIQRYWDIDLDKKIDISFEAACEQFRSMFIQSVQRRLRSDVPVGSSLSGGLDSSSIVRVINETRGESHIQNTFSARFRNFEKDEGKYMQYVVDGTNINAHYTWVEPNYIVDSFEQICHHQEEPFGSTSIVAQHAVMRLAKEKDVTVLLDGQGADEYLAGYVKRYYKTYLKELYGHSDKKTFSEERLAYNDYFNRNFEGGLKLGLELQAQGIIQKARDFKYRYLERQPAHLNTDFSKSVQDIIYPTKRFYDLKEQLKFSIQCQLPDLLRYADRNSMAFAREIRLPFLNHDLVEFVFALPHSYKLNKGWSKYILRKSLASYLPEPIAWRKEKVAFQPPQNRWIETKKFQDLIGDSKALLAKERIIQPSISKQFDWQCLLAAQLFA